MKLVEVSNISLFCASQSDSKSNKLTGNQTKKQRASQPQRPPSLPGVLHDPSGSSASTLWRFKNTKPKPFCPVKDDRSACSQRRAASSHLFGSPRCIAVLSSVFPAHSSRRSSSADLLRELQFLLNTCPVPPSCARTSRPSLPFIYPLPPADPRLLRLL